MPLPAGDEPLMPVTRPGREGRSSDTSMATLVAGCRSLITYAAVSFYLLVVGTPGLLLAIALDSKALLYHLGHIGVRMALALAGIRYTVTGAANVPPRAVVFCANHESNIDPPVLFEALHTRLHILYKAELSKLPLLGRAMQVGGFIPIERQNREQAMAAISRGAASIRGGDSFLIFPEGTRSRTRELLPFKKGGFIMALEAQAPIVPVAISGGRAAMRKGSPIVRPVRVTVRIGEPVETAGFGVEDRDGIIAEVRRRIESLLAENG